MEFCSRVRGARNKGVLALTMQKFRQTVLDKFGLRGWVTGEVSAASRDDGTLYACPLRTSLGNWATEWEMPAGV